jgi:hypothetical protein
MDQKMQDLEMTDLKMTDWKIQELKQCDSWPGLNRGYYSSGGHTRLRLSMEFKGLRIKLGIRMVALEELFLVLTFVTIRAQARGSLPCLVILLS